MTGKKSSVIPSVVEESRGNERRGRGKRKRGRKRNEKGNEKKGAGLSRKSAESPPFLWVWVVELKMK